MKGKHRWGASVLVLALGSTLTASRAAHAQAGNPFPITTLPSPTAPSPTPAPDQPSSALLPATAAPAATPATAEAAHETDSSAALDAEQPRHFGEQGQVAISGQLSASLGFLSYDQSPASHTSASIEPAFHYFFADHWLVGGSMFMRYEGGTNALGIKASTNTFGASLRFGGDIPFGNALSLEPVAGLGFWQAQTTFEQPEPGATASLDGAAIPVGGDVTQTAVFVSLYAPLLVHPAAHFFLGIGPEAFRDLTNSVESTGMSVSPRRTFVGVSSVVGGWF